jgi:DUF971 family protein
LETKYQPANIELDVRTELKIEWYDGHESAFALDHLRKECPCANCQNQRAEEAENPNPFKVLSGNVVAKAEALNMEAIGNYALKFDWNDDHNSGIYTFQYLRDLCPCEECKG